MLNIRRGRCFLYLQSLRRSGTPDTVSYFASMGEFRSFLESSTIHGLSYISTTRKHVRIIWTAIVIACFIAASILIEESFKTWSDNPITTTIETRPISEIKFPKVTVCPSKDTFTDLNNVLMEIGNKTFEYDLTNENTSVYQVLEKFITFFQHEDFKQRFAKIETFIEHDRFKNWYQSKSNAKFPAGDELSIETSAPSGVITSPYFQEGFDLEKFDKMAQYFVHIISPYRVQMTLYLKVEYETLENYECLRVHGIRTGTVTNCLPNDKKFFETNWFNFRKTTIVFTRVASLSSTSIKEVLMLRNVTGFRLSWKFSTNITTDLAQTYKPKFTLPNKAFIGFSNLLFEMKEHKMGDLWKVVREVETFKLKFPELKLYSFSSFRQTKAEYKLEIEDIGRAFCTFGYNCYNGRQDLYIQILEVIAQKMNMKASLSLLPVYDNISDLLLAQAAQFYIYLVTDQNKYWMKWYKGSLSKIVTNVTPCYNDKN